jgi:hypothetical protein
MIPRRLPFRCLWVEPGSDVAWFLAPVNLPLSRALSVVCASDPVLDDLRRRGLLEPGLHLHAHLPDGELGRDDAPKAWEWDGRTFAQQAASYSETFLVPPDLGAVGVLVNSGLEILGLPAPGAHPRVRRGADGEVRVDGDARAIPHVVLGTLRLSSRDGRMRTVVDAASPEHVAFLADVEAAGLRPSAQGSVDLVVAGFAPWRAS